MADYLYRRHVRSCPGHREWGAGNWRVITTSESQHKIAKSLGKGVYTGVLHLAPAEVSGFNVCPWSTPGCRASCLNLSGMGMTTSTQTARITKAVNVMQSKDSRTEFLLELVKDIRSVETGARNRGLAAAIRLNGTSDLPWENWPVCVNGTDYPNLMALFPEIQFYDYTKGWNRAFRSRGEGIGAERWPRNYQITFSYSDDPQSLNHAVHYLSIGGGVAVVFRTRADLERAMERGWHGYPVLDATQDDVRFDDPPGHVAGLVALVTKGKTAQLDETGFVVDYPEEGSLRVKQAAGFSLTSRSAHGRYRRFHEEDVRAVPGGHTWADAMWSGGTLHETHGEIVGPEGALPPHEWEMPDKLPSRVSDYQNYVKPQPTGSIASSIWTGAKGREGTFRLRARSERARYRNR